jgi:hypothetical protein
MEQFQLGNSGLDPLIRTENDRVLGRFGHLNILVNAITALQETPPGSGIASVTGDIVDNTDPLNPVIAFATDANDFTGAGNPEDKLKLAVSYSAGTWTPTIDNELVIFQSGYYTQIGDIVFASFTGTFTLAEGSSAADFNFTLPIEPANNFDTLYYVVGVINLHNANSVNIQQKINSNIGALTCNARIRSNAVGAFSVQIQYNTNN